MDILVTVPLDQESHVWATKLNPTRGFTDGYWTLRGLPRFLKKGDRIWFALLGEVIASARVRYPRANFDGDHFEDELEPAVCFDIQTVVRHEFSTPRELPLGFRGFRYVRRANKHLSPARTKALAVVGAKTAESLHPRNW